MNSNFRLQVSLTKNENESNLCVLMNAALHLSGGGGSGKPLAISIKQR